MQCSYFDAGVCRSCTLMGTPHAQQVADKQLHAESLLAAHAELGWLEPLAAAESGFRNKAKMVVGGTVEAPTLGILDEHRVGVDLTGCGICAPGLRATFPAITGFITRARLAPYDVPARRGELKQVLLTEAADGALMLRFVLRSTEALGRIRKHLPELMAAVPRLSVVTVNLLPEHRAVVEGDDEIVLTETAALPMPLDGLTLSLRPKSFFQTNTEIASALYRQGRRWVDDAAPASVWDLYCGVGGFALAVADDTRDVLGIEVSAEAIAAATATAEAAGLRRARFAADDATAFARGAAEHPDLVIVNPPRRGLGDELCDWLETSRVRTVVYSSCNAVSLARDLQRMPSLRPMTARVFDMFPQTAHYEVMVLLERAG